MTDARDAACRRSRAVLPERVDGALPPRLDRAAGAHVRGCERCTALAAALRSLVRGSWDGDRAGGASIRGLQRVK